MGQKQKREINKIISLNLNAQVIIIPRITSADDCTQSGTENIGLSYPCSTNHTMMKCVFPYPVVNFWEMERSRLMP